MAVVQYIFTHKQYIDQHNKNTQNNTIVSIVIKQIKKHINIL